MTELNEFFYPRGSLARDGWESAVDSRIPGATYTGIHVTSLDGHDVRLTSHAVERIVVPLAGSFSVEHGGETTELIGRASVFDGPTDVLYVGMGGDVRINGRGRVAVAEAPTSIARPAQYMSSASVPVEVRGVGKDTRQVHNFGTPEGLDAAALLVCEVITPAGNWSSHPAHKHDQAIVGVETELEEIYYFEAAPTRDSDAPADADAFGSFSTYSSAVGQIETRALVRSGDIALVPYGYHGPAAAAPEFDLYYLNVMAGPGPERRWMFSDDPRQAWIRAAWQQGAPDPRLPYVGGSSGRAGANTTPQAHRRSGTGGIPRAPVDG
jgi:5-deoxy-glucuronate isomerase